LVFFFFFFFLILDCMEGIAPTNAIIIIEVLRAPKHRTEES